MGTGAVVLTSIGQCLGGFEWVNGKRRQVGRTPKLASLFAVKLNSIEHFVRFPGNPRGVFPAI